MAALIASTQPFHKADLMTKRWSSTRSDLTQTKRGASKKSRHEWEWESDEITFEPGRPYDGAIINTDGELVIPKR